jgi:hypothetical protein
VRFEDAARRTSVPGNGSDVRGAVKPRCDVHFEAAARRASVSRDGTEVRGAAKPRCDVHFEAAARPKGAFRAPMPPLGRLLSLSSPPAWPGGV